MSQDMEQPPKMGERTMLFDANTELAVQLPRVYNSAAAVADNRLRPSCYLARSLQ